MLAHIPWWAGVYLMVMAAMVYFEFFVASEAVEGDDEAALAGFDLYARAAMYLGGAVLVVSYAKDVNGQWIDYTLFGTAIIVAALSLYFMVMEVFAVVEGAQNGEFIEDGESPGWGALAIGYTISNSIHIGGIVFAVLVAVQVLTALPGA